VAPLVVRQVETSSDESLHLPRRSRRAWHTLPVIGNQKHQISYGVFRPLLSVMGLGPAFSGVTRVGNELRVAMGWGFRATVPLASITDAVPTHGMIGGIGVHGWRGSWLVNGAASGLVCLTIDPPVRAQVIGVPVTLKRLTLSMEQPEDFLRSLGY